ncbi:MAG: GlsB/YeaQ/YmgE family stress response membrane protein [Verrucomicrobiota bacterium JB023]|nr:GlsB/YeaQ/YmgE family stress response membrane protein [Verrucomicrobiota bacterium JB023]
MTVIAWIIIGIVAGVLAKLIMPGKDPGGFIVTILLGIGGGILAGFLGNLLFDRGTIDARGIPGFDDIIAATFGAVLILLAYRFFKKKNDAPKK